MKFIKLEILNLASLDREEGETIHFTSGALGESNIFSIVGPTGSGKSESGKTKCARFGKRNVQKSGKTKRSKKFAHTTL